MKKHLCSGCGAENDPRARYCWQCGDQLPRRQGPGEFLKSLNPRSLAGAGLRSTNVAPLFTKDLMDHEYPARGGLTPVRPLEDQSWFCPDCGQHNVPFQTVCKGCGRAK